MRDTSCRADASGSGSSAGLLWRCSSARQVESKVSPPRTRPWLDQNGSRFPKGTELNWVKRDLSKHTEPLSYIDTCSLAVFPTPSINNSLKIVGCAEPKRGPAPSQGARFEFKILQEEKVAQVPKVLPERCPGALQQGVAGRRLRRGEIHSTGWESWTETDSVAPRRAPPLVSPRFTTARPRTRSTTMSAAFRFTTSPVRRKQ